MSPLAARVLLGSIVVGSAAVAVSGVVLRALERSPLAVMAVVGVAVLAVAAGAALLWRPLSRLEAERNAAERELVETRATADRFLGDVAHDLRAPLGSLQLALEEMTLHGAPPARLDLLRRALNDVVYLGALVANLRLATRVRGGWKPEPRAAADLAAVVRRVSDRARAFAGRVGIELEAAWPDTEVPVRCHGMLAEQALQNLVDNAIRYGDHGGHVSIVLDAHRDRFTLAVRDDGPGVPPADLPRLVERAFRGQHAMQEDPSGTGLGLAIVSWVCEQAGWELRFARVDPRGLEVEIRGALGAGASA